MATMVSCDFVFRFHSAKFPVTYFIIVHLVLGGLTWSVSIIDRRDSCQMDKYKCTERDPRLTFPRCMLYTVDKSLWCDQSKYKKIPDPDNMDVMPKLSGHNATALYINDSCLLGLEESDMVKYNNITVFMCGSNYIKKLEKNLFAHNKDLERIDFCGNQITTIDDAAFTGLGKLKLLNLANNKISDLGQLRFMDLEFLLELSLHNNQISDLKNFTFTGLWNLKILKLTRNQLDNIREKSFYHLPKLTHLHLDDNRLTEIGPGRFDRLVSLKVLTLSYNFLTTLNQNELPMLHTLNVAFNRIEVIETSAVAKLSKLQNLSLKNNSLKILSEDIFRETTHMRHLDLSNNNMNEVNKTIFFGLCYLEKLLADNHDWSKTIIKEIRKDCKKSKGVFGYRNFMPENDPYEYSPASPNYVKVTTTTTVVNAELTTRLDRERLNFILNVGSTVPVGSMNAATVHKQAHWLCLVFLFNCLKNLIV